MARAHMRIIASGFSTVVRSRTSWSPSRTYTESGAGVSSFIRLRCRFIRTRDCIRTLAGARDLAAFRTFFASSRWHSLQRRLHPDRYTFEGFR